MDVLGEGVPFPAGYRHVTAFARKAGPSVCSWFRVTLAPRPSGQGASLAVPMSRPCPACLATDPRPFEGRCIVQPSVVRAP